MAKVIKFALELKNGESARTMEDLRAHFDLEKIVSYFLNGRLMTWLRHRHLDAEADALEKLSHDDAALAKKLCEILGVSYDEHQAHGETLDADAVKESNERMNALRQVTSDPEILAKIDRVAFDEMDFRRLAYGTGTEVYLCNGRFTIPLNVQNKHYIGIGKAEVVIASEKRVDFEEKGIRFTNVGFDEEYQKVAARETPKELLEKGKAAYDAGNLDEALQWYRQAADAGNGEAMNKIGSMYAKGEGVENDCEKAAQWYRQAADANFVPSMGNLGLLYVMGAGVPQDIEKGLRLLKKGAEEAPQFLCTIGDLYEVDLGDCTEASKWFKKAAENEKTPIEHKKAAMYRLGNMYNYADGVAKNQKEAHKWYLKAAELGSYDAMFQLGVMYDAGEAVPRNTWEAHKWYLKAAEGGNSAAMYCLGSKYNSGSESVARSHKQAEYWMTKAAEAGDEDAQRWVEEDRKWVYEFDSDFKGYEGY